MEHWHPDRALAFGKLLWDKNRFDLYFKEPESWTGFGPSYNQVRSTMPNNPFNTLRRMVAQYGAGEEKMAYDREHSALETIGQRGTIMKPRTFREQMQDQIAYHEAKIANLKGVLDAMTPEVEKFVEALQKAEI